MWNVNIPWNFHGIHVEYVGSIRIPTWNPHGIHMECIYSMDSIWNIFHYINKVFIHMDSTWNEHRIIPGGFHVDSMWIPCGFQVDSRWNERLSRIWE